MAETRSQAQRKEATVRDLEEMMGSFKAQMLERTQALESTVATQQEKMASTVAELFESVRLFTGMDPKTVASTRPPDRPPPPVPPLQTPITDLTTHTPQNPPTNYAGVTTLAKIDFPRFDGTGFKDWLFKVEQFFVIDRTPSEYMVGLASIHMDGEAGNWHRSVIESEIPVVGWQEWAV
ncbi:uncharacterized protein LOC112086806 [Eutrema salsugineum]|uniref:uncharacterized protein LOC112086806 n=1 Tax=Eutrema salsugineum TaxID=72664 RepID=UPI000CECF4B3|nr:uncharacterized protein LOC112086806 [Eutrema salsugineum]